MYEFDIREIFDVAIKLEESGERFYRHLAHITQDKKAQNTFTYLADEEVKHKKLFEEMRAKFPRREAQETHAGEYIGYLHDYVNRLIFTPKKLEDEWVKRKDTVAAIEFGVRRELDSILYYQEIKAYVTEHQRRLVDNIIGEERKHFLTLLELHESYTKERELPT
jgi:rubrerythrin